MTQRSRYFAILFLILCFVPCAWSGDSIPKAAWKRAIGAPLPNAGTRKPNLTDLIDDGYWQGAPVGGSALEPFHAHTEATFPDGISKAACTSMRPTT